MKLKEAFSRLGFTISKQNKPNQSDADALNSLLEHFKKSEEKTIQENLLFAKLYTFLLKELVINYNDVDFANKQINKILSEPMDFHIEILLVHLKSSEVTKVFSDPILENKSGEELKEVFRRHPKFEKEFLTCFDWWDKDNVISHLNTNINLSIQNFKNHD